MASPTRTTSDPRFPEDPERFRNVRSGQCVKAALDAHWIPRPGYQRSPNRRPCAWQGDAPPPLACASQSKRGPVAGEDATTGARWLAIHGHQPGRQLRRSAWWKCRAYADQSSHAMGRTSRIPSQRPYRALLAGASPARGRVRRQPPLSVSPIGRPTQSRCPRRLHFGSAPNGKTSGNRAPKRRERWRWSSANTGGEHPWVDTHS